MRHARRPNCLETSSRHSAQVYSVKPLVGHCQGAASAVEVAAAALGYDDGVIPAPPIVAPGHAQLLDGAPRSRTASL